MTTDDVQVIAPNFKKRWSGVTSTIFRLLPLQRSSMKIVCMGPNLPDHLPQITVQELLNLPARPVRVWHARRNIEMLAGLVLARILRKRFRLMFTSAAQRRHSAYTRWLIRQMDHVVATSARAALYLERPSTVIMHGVDTDRFRPSADKAALKSALGLPQKRLVGCFGRIRHQKGTDIFVDVMLKVAQDLPDVCAVIIGSTTADNRKFMDDLQSRVAQAGMTDRILFAGEQPDERVPDYFGALDLFVAPQRWEGFGLTPLEAMASGVPVVATRVGAFEEMIKENETGHLVEIEDAAAMEAAVRDMLQADATLASMGSAARAHVEKHFQLSKEAEALNTIYQELLDRP